MSCHEQQQNASGFIDGELDPARQAILFAHLAGCTECQSFMETSMRIRDRHEDIEYPADLDETVLGRLMRAREIRVAGFWRRRVVLPVPALAAAAIILIFLMVGLFNRGREQSKPAGFAQPTAVIMIYGIPPVEILGKIPVTPANQFREQ